MARFLSKYKGLIITVKPARSSVQEPGKRITFENGEFVTEDKNEIKFLRDYAAKHVEVTEDVKPAPLKLSEDETGKGE